MNRTTAIGMLAIALVGCGEKRAAQEEAMPGMGGMVMRADSLIPPMRAHLDSLAAMPAASVPGMVTAHDAMASEMLDAMGSDMTMMGMQPDSVWAALTDSLKRDLADLPALTGRLLESRMRAHVERMRRLLDLHERMM